MSHATMIRASCFIPVLLVFAAACRAGEKGEAEAIASRLLDGSVEARERQALVETHLEQGAPIIAALTRDLPEGPEEYRRIPWIWRVAVAAGRRNSADQVREILKLSLPRDGEPLRDWQAVVVGGGIVNGISERGIWPAERIAEVIDRDEELKARWQRTMLLSTGMADDEQIPTGTRYDALRVLGCGAWQPHGEQLAGYLKEGTHAELQMGAVSGLADLDALESTHALAGALSHLTGRNRELALDGLLRTPTRALALLDAVRAGQVKPSDLGDQRIRQLREHPVPEVRRRAAVVLSR